MRTATTNAAMTQSAARTAAGQYHHRPSDCATSHVAPEATPTRAVPTSVSHTISSASAKAMTTTTKSTKVRLNAQLVAHDELDGQGDDGSADDNNREPSDDLGIDARKRPDRSRVEQPHAVHPSHEPLRSGWRVTASSFCLAHCRSSLPASIRRSIPHLDSTSR